MSIKVSFIVPVYNVENYLDKCVASILDQGIPKSQLEIILINDGSSDSSLSICEKWKEKEDCIHLINQLNQGVGSARNAGLAHASGDWICFVDPDDYLTKGSISYILSHFQLDTVDVVRYFFTEEPEGSFINDSSIGSGDILFSGCSKDYTEKYSFSFDPYIPLHFIRRSFLDHNLLRFTDHVIAEDRLFLCNVLMSSPNVLVVSCNVYHYVRRHESATMTRSGEKLTLGILNQLDAFYRAKHCVNENGSELANIQCVKSLQRHLVWVFDRISFSSLSLKSFVIITSELKKEGLVPIHNNEMMSREAIVFINTMCRYPLLYLILKQPLKWYIKRRHNL